MSTALTRLYAGIKAKKVTATHVIIGGIVFPWSEKKPYVIAGKSVSGALEYNQEHDVLKCHVCGEWRQVLAKHISSDGVTPKEYRQTYGLRYDTSLSAPRVREKRAQISKANSACLIGHGTFGTAEHMNKARAASALTRKSQNTHCRETTNLKMLCAAQIRVRVLRIAVELNGTPTIKELQARGINSGVIRLTFGLNHSDFMRSLGLLPNHNKGGRMVREGLPPQTQIMREEDAGLMSPLP